MLLLNACRHRCIKGDGNVTTENRSISSFNSIQVSSALKVIYTQSSEYKLEVVADDNLIGYIKTEINGDELQIDIKDQKCFKKITQAEIHVSGPTINRIEVSGASIFETANSIISPGLTMEISGASKININGQLAMVTAKLSGASKADLAGNSNLINIESSGASEFNSNNLIANSAFINFSGASFGNIYVHSALNATLSGASKLNYYGNPTVNSNLSGASSINKK